VNANFLIMKKVLLFFFLIVFLGCNTSTKSNTSIKLLSPTEFKTQSEGNVLVDIRTPEEYKQGHIVNATNINFYDKNFLSKFEEFNKNEPIYIYCRSGNRTSKAASKLVNMGFTKVYDLKNGINNWKKENLKIVR